MVYLRLSIGALLAGVLCGAANVLVDCDHIPYYIFRVDIIPVLFNIFGFASGRFLHPALFFVGIIGLACTTGLLCRLGLKGE